MLSDESCWQEFMPYHFFVPLDEPATHMSKITKIQRFTQYYRDCDTHCFLVYSCLKRCSFFFIISLKLDFFKDFGLSVEQQCIYSFEKQHGFNILVSKMWKRKHSYSISLKSYNVLFHLTHNQIPKGILYTIQKSRKSELSKRLRLRAFTTCLMLNTQGKGCSIELYS